MSKSIIISGQEGWGLQKGWEVCQGVQNSGAWPAQVFTLAEKIY